ncbi:hypothetical protein GCM10023339_07580 [Alloalcanivorax gelatiniphagus]
MRSSRNLLITGAVLGAFLAPVSAGHATVHDAAAGTTDKASAPTCGQADQGFIPTRLRIPGVVGPTRVLALGRDRHGVPRTPPLTEAGKWQAGYDRASGIRPGESHGVVRLAAHTYPWSGDHGLALGNRLLQELRVGQRIVVTGATTERTCYKVTRSRQVPAASRPRDYYSSSGPSRLAILVCSGTRRGPGDWSHRTIWYATPVT